MEYHEQLQLKDYGILATNAAQVSIKDDVLSIRSAQIDEMNLECEKLKKEKIKKIYIFGSEIQYIYFTENTTIDIDFGCCNFKNQVIAREHKFNNTIAFTQCIFETIVDFSGATFKCQVDFFASIFKDKASFIETQFLAKQGNGEIENNFRQSIFEGNTSFDGAEFKGRVDFRISTFKDKARFIKTQFLAEQGNGEIENNFRESVFEGDTSFYGAIFQGRVNFGISRFKAETRFIETQFLAKQGNGETIENDFGETSFEGNASFDSAIFQGRVSFGISRFKAETRFIETQFLAKQGNGETIENDFGETSFEGNAYFSGAIFQGRVDFRISTFKDKARFIKTQFLAEQDNGEIIENNFRESVFEGDTSFYGAIFQERVNFGISRFKDETRFIETQFLARQGNGEIENDFGETSFEGNTSFDGAIFQERVNFGISRFKAEARFINTKFLAKQGNGETIENDFGETSFEGNAYFSGAIFQGRVDFRISRFKDEVSFAAINLDKCIFDYTEFNKTKFIKIDYKNAETYTFRNSTFKDILSFENTNISKLEFDNVVFNGIVTFNEANFSNKPSFTNCTFSNQFNIEHKHIQYRYEDIYEDIKETQDYSQLLNYRDLFRKLKSNRIAHHNLIDASELHSQELYARELELDSKKTKTLKEKVEKWQLWFYHKLCDHHTDLLLNLKWLIIAIGLFTSLYFVSRLIQDISILESLNPFGICFSIACAFVMLVLYWFGHIERLDFFASINAVITLWIICYKPQLIFGIANLLGNIKYNGFENFLITIYTIVIGLIIFSLQKTARKNSIVPN